MNPISIVTWIIAGLVGLAILAWLGLRLPAQPFPPHATGPQESTTVALPAGLPPPVDRFYRDLYGDAVPVIDTAVVSGTARLRIRGITMPARFRFVYDVGHAYRHLIETTFFGFPVLKVDESFIEGSARMELPFGVVENEPRIDQAANLGLWAEAVWFPAAWITDDRVTWEPLDATTAVLVVPGANGSERFLARFGPGTGRLWMLESMRYRDQDSDAKTLWLNEVLAWDDVGGHTAPARATLTWFDEGTPWARWSVEEVVYGADVSNPLRNEQP